MSGKVIFTTGSFLGEMGTTADGELFINSHGKTKGVVLEGVKQFSQSAAGELIERDIDASTGETIRTIVKDRDTGTETIYSGSSATRASSSNQIEFKQDNNNALIIASGSNPGLNCIKSADNSYGFYRSKMISFYTASEIRTIGVPSGPTTDLLISNNIVQGSGKTGIRYAPQASAVIQLSGSVEISGSDNFTFGGDLYIGENIYHTGDEDTYLGFQDNLVNLVAGGKSVIKLDWGNSNDKIQINNTNVDLDLQVMADDGEVILHTDAGDNRVGINTTTPNKALEVTGDISASGNVYVQDDLYIGDDNAAGGDWIKHNQDSDTYFGFSGANNISFYAGSSLYYRMIMTATETQIGAGDDYDFRVTTDGDGYALFVRGSDNLVGIGASNPTKKLQVTGDISASGDLYIQSGQNINVDGTAVTTFNTSADSGSLALSGSLLLNNNSLIPAASASRLYNKDGYLFWGGTSELNKPSLISPTIHLEMSTYSYNGASKVYVPFGIDYESTGITSVYDRTAFSYSGRLLSVKIISSQISDETIVGFHRGENTTPQESTMVDITAIDTPYTAYFSSSAFDADDLLHISIDVETSNNHIHNVISTWQLDVVQDWPTQV